MDRPRTFPYVASWASLASGMGALLLPKCPACVAAYGSGLTALGLGPLVQQRLTGPLLTTAVVLSFAVVLVLSLRRRDVLTPLVSAAGAALVFSGAFADHRPAVVTIGAMLLVAAALVNTARCRSATA